MQQQSLETSTQARSRTAALAGAFLGIMITVPAVFVTIASLGIGEKERPQVLVKLLFPYSCFLGEGVSVETSSGWARTLYALLRGSARGGDGFTVPLIMLGLAQFPTYGAIIAYAARRGRLPLLIAVAGIACLHGLIFLAVFPTPF